MDLERIIPERLKPLLTRLKNPPTNDDESLEAQLHKEIAPTAIRLIEQGISLHLTAKFQDDRKLEEFVWWAAMAIDTPNKEERKTHWETWINKSFEDVFNKLVEIDDICKDGIIKDCKWANTSKKIDNIKAELTKLKKTYLSKLSSPSRPDNMDMLINLFLEYLPEVDETFIDEHIRIMLKPFGIELRPNVVRIRKYRSEKRGEWFIQKGKYFVFVHAKE